MSTRELGANGEDVRDRLLRALQRTPALANLRVDDPDDWLVAVCDAWAALARLVEFYDQQTMAEAFLDTAEQPASIERLYHSLGHAFPPNATAMTTVAYHLTNKTPGVEAVARTRQAGTGSSAPTTGAAPGQPAGTASTSAPATGRRPGTPSGVAAPATANPTGPGSPAAPGSPAVPGRPGVSVAGRTPPPVGVSSVVASGSQVRAVPAAGTIPPTFVTRNDLAAHVGASRLRVAVPPPAAPALLVAGTTQLDLVGTRTGLAVGQPLLIEGRTADGHAPRRWVRILTTVAVSASRKLTRVGWDQPLSADWPDWSAVVGPAVYGFASASSLVGAGAADWGSLPLDRRRGVRTPAGDPVALTGGCALSADGGASWTLAQEGLPSATALTATRAYGDLLVIAAGPRLWWRAGKGAFTAASVGGARRDIGRLGGRTERMLAAGAAGTVLQSIDDGVSWSAVTGSPPSVQVTAEKPDHTATAPSTVATHQLPSARVRAIAELTAAPPGPDGLPPLLAGTDSGLYRYDGTDWNPVAALTSAVFDLLVPAAGHLVVAATTDGVWSSPDGTAWTRLGTGISGRVYALAGPGGQLLAGTDDGIWSLDQTTWSQVNSRGPATALVATVDGTALALQAGGLVRSTDGGRSWGAAPTTVPVFTWPASALDGALAALSGGAQTVPVALVRLFAAEGVTLSAAATIDPQPDGSRLLTDGPRGFVLRPAPAGGWTVALDGALGAVTALDPGDGGPVTAVAGVLASIADEWPGFAVDGSSVEIAPPVRALATGLPAVIEQRTTDALVAQVLEVSAVGQQNGSRFGRLTALTTVTFGGPPLSPGVFPRRASTLWTGAVELALAPVAPPAVSTLQGTELPLAHSLLAPLEPGRLGSVSGRPVGLGVAPLGGLWSLADGDRPTRRGPAEIAVDDLAVDAFGVAYAATADGVYGVTDRYARLLLPGWPGGACAGVASMSVEVPVLLAIGPSGDLYARRGTDAWAAVDPPPPAPISALTCHDGMIVVAAADRVWSCPADAVGDRAGGAEKPVWSVSGAAVPERVRRLVPLGDRLAAIAGDRRTVYTLDADRWTRLGGSQPSGVLDLAVDGTGALWAATAAGLVSFDPRTADWSDPAVDDAVSALTSDEFGRLVAVGAEGVWRLQDGRWTSVGRLGGLAVSCAVAAPDGTVWIGTRAAVDLVAGPGRPPVSLGHERVCSAVAVDHRDLATLDQGALPDCLVDALTTAGHGSTAQATSISGSESQGWWLLQGAGGLAVAALRTDGKHRWLDVTAGTDTVHPLGPPVVDGDVAEWTVVADDLTATLRTPADMVVLLPAGHAAPALAETIRLAGTPVRDPAGRGTTLALASPLRHVYDATTVVVNLNVVDAAQGRPVATPIGSGDARRTHQSFPIRTPVAAVGGGPADPDRPPASSLVISVDGQPWSEVASFAGSGPTATVYAVWRNADGTATVHFGDGVHGARLPTGQDNVVAGYLQGGGAAGATAAGALIQPLDRPQLVVAVHNPVAALVPAGPSPVAARQAAVRVLDAPVTLADYVDLAAAQPGVTAATAELVGGRAVVLTMVAPGASAGLLDRVTAAVGRVSVTGLPVRVVAAPAVPVGLHLDVVGTGHTLADDVVVALAGFTAPRAGAPLTAARVLARVGSVAGVRGSAIIGWGRAGQPSGQAERLRAAGARWPRGAADPVGAELLVVDGKAGRLRVDVRAAGGVVPR